MTNAELAKHLEKIAESYGTEFPTVRDNCHSFGYICTKAAEALKVVENGILDLKDVDVFGYAGWMETKNDDWHNLFPVTIKLDDDCFVAKYKINAAGGGYSVCTDSAYKKTWRIWKFKPDKTMMENTMWEE